MQTPEFVHRPKWIWILHLILHQHSASMSSQYCTGCTDLHTSGSPAFLQIASKLGWGCCYDILLYQVFRNSSGIPLSKIFFPAWSSFFFGSGKHLTCKQKPSLHEMSGNFTTDRVMALILLPFLPLMKIQ